MVIYSITNSINNKKYIGQSTQKNGKHRFVSHLSYLRRNKHPNQHLQNAFNKYGETAFKFEVIENAFNQDELNVLEQKYIEEYKSFDKQYGYNKRSGGRFHKLSEESKEKIRKNHYGLKASTETKLKMSIARKGKTQTKEWIAKRSGEGTKRARLTNEIVLEMRNMYIPHKVTAYDVAEHFKLPYGTTQKVLNRITWKHI